MVASRLAHVGKNGQTMRSPFAALATKFAPAAAIKERNPMMESRSYPMMHVFTALAAAGTLSGCLQTAPVAVTPQEQASRVVYNCPNAKTLDVTRLRSSNAVVLVVDGSTLQLSRDAGYTSAERYTNRLQTLTLSGSSATYDSIGRASYGPCTLARDGTPEGREQRQSRD